MKLLILRKSKAANYKAGRIDNTPDTRLEKFRKLILEHLSTLDDEEAEPLEMRKAFSSMIRMEKGGKGLAVGTVREWKGRKFKKIAPGKWRPVYDSETRGAKMAIAAIKRKIAAAPDAQTMMRIILENRDRFSDKNGQPLPFVQELSKYTADQQDRRGRAGHGKTATDKQYSHRLLLQSDFDIGLVEDYLKAGMKVELVQDAGDDVVYKPINSTKGLKELLDTGTEVRATYSKENAEKLVIDSSERLRESVDKLDNQDKNGKGQEKTPEKGAEGNKGESPDDKEKTEPGSKKWEDIPQKERDEATAALYEAWKSKNPGLTHEQEFTKLRNTNIEAFKQGNHRVYNRSGLLLDTYFKDMQEKLKAETDALLAERDKKDKEAAEKRNNLRHREELNRQISQGYSMRQEYNYRKMLGTPEEIAKINNDIEQIDAAIDRLERERNSIDDDGNITGTEKKQAEEQETGKQGGGGDGGDTEDGEDEKSTRARLREKFETLAVPMKTVKFTRKNYDKLFPGGILDTPLGEVKMGEHQFEKLGAKGREDLLWSLKQTLTDPIVIFSSGDTKIYAKSFMATGKTKGVISVIIKKEGKNISISTHRRDISNIINKIKKGNVLYEKDVAKNEDNASAETIPSQASDGGSLKTGGQSPSSRVSPESGGESSDFSYKGRNAAMKAVKILEEKGDTSKNFREALDFIGSPEFEKLHEIIDDYMDNVFQSGVNMEKPQEADLVRYVRNYYGAAFGAGGVPKEIIDEYDFINDYVVWPEKLQSVLRDHIHWEDGKSAYESADDFARLVMDIGDAESIDDIERLSKEAISKISHAANGESRNLKKAISNAIDFFRNLSYGKGPRFVKKAVPVRGAGGAVELSERWIKESIEGITPHADDAGISDIEKSLTWSGYPLQGRAKVHGMDISIENKKGSVRSGTDKDGHDWSIKMNFDYGYIRGTVGKDKDHVDCYVGPNPEAETVFIVHQNDPETGKYDEDKVMLGFDSEEEARKAYLSQYDRPGFLGDIDAMDIEEFKEKAFDPKNKGKRVA